jgi:hypothetical protein
MNFLGNFGEVWGGFAHHPHYHPVIFSGLPVSQVGHHLGMQTVGGYSATDPW